MKRIISTSLKSVAFAAVLSLGSNWALAAEKPDTAIQVTLRSSVTVTSEKILLGDVFNGVGKYADRPIAHSPAPGEQMLLKATWLWRVANMFDVNWRPASRLDTSTVYRDSIAIAPEQIEQEISAALQNMLVDIDMFEVEFEGQVTPIHLPTDADHSIAIGDLQIDSTRGWFSGTVVAPATGPRQAVVPISGRIHRLAEVAVPNRRIRPGDIITANDLNVITMRVTRLDRNKLLTSEDMIGQSAKRVLMEGRPISHSDIRPPVLVTRNGIVTVALETPFMRLTAQAKALEDGAKSDVIRVENLKSGQLVEVVVTGPNQATVVSPLQSAMR